MKKKRKKKQRRRTSKYQIREHPQNMRLGNMYSAGVRYVCAASVDMPASSVLVFSKSQNL